MGTEDYVPSGQAAVQAAMEIALHRAHRQLGLAQACCEELHHTHAEDDLFQMRTFVRVMLDELRTGRVGAARRRAARDAQQRWGMEEGSADAAS